MYKMPKVQNKLTKEQKDIDIMANIRSTVLYALSFSVALGFNDVVLTIFDSFTYSQHIIAKTTYVVILFGLTLLAAESLSGMSTPSS
jgi:hypothetical protein